MPSKRDALTIPELARRAGVGQTAWKAHRAAGAPAPRSARKADVDRWLREYGEWRQQHGKVPSTERAAGATAATAEHQHWTTRKQKWLALTAQLRLGRETKALVPRADVIEFARRAALVCRARLNEMVQSVTLRVRAAADDDAARELFQAAVDEACDQFERGMIPPEVQDAEPDPEPAE
jgi:hypothetical protein